MRVSDDVIMRATLDAMKEKLTENQHKGPLTALTLHSAVELMKGELWELLEELHAENLDYAKVRRELADVVNFAGAAICDCDRVISIGKIINNDLPKT